jgi:hypothetical protein
MQANCCTATIIRGVVLDIMYRSANLKRRGLRLGFFNRRRRAEIEEADRG